MTLQSRPAAWDRRALDLATRGRVVLIGWPAGPEPSCGRETVRLQPADVFRVPLVGCATIVLGLDAIEEMDPGEMRRALGRAADRAVICVADCDGALLMRWAHVGFRDVVDPEALDALLTMQSRSSQRPLVPIETWRLRAPLPGSEMERAIAVLPTLAHLSVAAWAAALPSSERSFFDLCVRWAGLSPRELLTRYRLFVAFEARAGGATLDECAAAASYADVSCLLRTCRRRKTTMPHAPRAEA